MDFNNFVAFCYNVATFLTKIVACWKRFEAFSDRVEAFSDKVKAGWGLVESCCA